MDPVVFGLGRDRHGSLLTEEVRCVIALHRLLPLHFCEVAALPHDRLTLLAREDLLADRLRCFRSGDTSLGLEQAAVLGGHLALRLHGLLLALETLLPESDAAVGILILI